jgi:hypothetical protein
MICASLGSYRLVVTDFFFLVACGSQLRFFFPVARGSQLKFFQFHVIVTTEIRPLAYGLATEIFSVAFETFFVCHMWVATQIFSPVAFRPQLRLYQLHVGLAILTKITLL